MRLSQEVLLPSLLPYLSLTDLEVVDRVRAGDVGLYELLMRRHNRRLFHVVRGVLRDDAEIEDVMQHTYVAAFTHLDQYAGSAAFSTWLCRIGLHEALARQRRSGRQAPGEDRPDGELEAPTTKAADDPEGEVSRREAGQLLEQAIDALPEHYRVVLLLRDVEEFSTAETADCLGLREDAVKVRLHRARGRLRQDLEGRLRAVATDLFPFAFPRCDRVVAGVFARLAAR